MAGRRTARVRSLAGIGVDRMGALASKKQESTSTGSSKDDMSKSQDKPLRMENLDTDVPPHPLALAATTDALSYRESNSYLPFIGQLGLRNAAAAHVSRMTGNVASYSGEHNCAITAGGLSGVLNTLFATVEPGEGVLLTDPTYIGLINRVKLVGAVPVLFPCEFRPGETWRFPREKLAAFVEKSKIPITAMLLASPALPSGMYLDAEDWHAISELCVEKDLLLLYDTAFERLLFDGRNVLHPASFPGMQDRTITIGSASKELRLIGWRVGWIVGPSSLIEDIRLVGMANVVVPVGIAQKAAQVALGIEGDVEGFKGELERRRDLLMEEFRGLEVGVPAGGWSFVLRVEGYGMSGKEASAALMEEGVYVTPMDGWGEVHGGQYVRFVFSNEPCERLKGIGEKVRRALKLS